MARQTRQRILDASLAMFNAFVTTVSRRRSTRARATSVVVVPPVRPIAPPSGTREAASAEDALNFEFGPPVVATIDMRAIRRGRRPPPPSAA